jgi:hypothetical protein
MASGAVELSPDSGLTVAAKASSTVMRGDSIRQVGHFEEGVPPGDRFDLPAVWDVTGDQPRSLRTKSSRPTRLPTVDNPFDPEIFNRTYRNANQPIIEER